MIIVKDKAGCSGCTACYAACPHGAISMKPDGLGFMYPEIDGSRCTDCGLCEKVCAFRGATDALHLPVAKAVRAKDVQSIMRSRSLFRRATVRRSLRLPGVIGRR